MNKEPSVVQDEAAVVLFKLCLKYHLSLILLDNRAVLPTNTLTQTIFAGWFI